MKRAYKYRLYPNKAQTDALYLHLRVTRDLYNACLEQRQWAYKKHGKSLSFYDQSREVKDIRAALPEAALLTNDTLADVCKRAQLAFDAFFRRLKGGKGKAKGDGEAAGYPRYKSHRVWDSFAYTHYGKGCKLIGSKLRLKSIGEVKVRVHRPVEGEPKMATIKREGDKWFVVIISEVRATPLPATGRTVGIDVGLTHFLTTDEGETVENPRYYAKAQRALRVAHRSLSRKKKFGARWRKQVKAVAAKHRKVANARKHFHHTVAHDLVARHDAIFVEDLNVKGLAASSLARSVHDAGWSMFKETLKGHAEKTGRVLIEVDPRGTSQTCLCGQAVPKALSDRRHSCPACGASMGRDHMSAKVIKQRGEALLNMENAQKREEVARR